MTSTADHKTYAVLFAGGMGSRMNGARIPKQFLKLGGKPILAYTIDQFEQHPEVDGIVVVSLPDWIDYINDLLKLYHFKKVITVVPGGETGQQSIFNGLTALNEAELITDDAVVLIHDGVRPLIDGETISACIESVREKGPTATVAPAIETIIRTEDGKVDEIIDRSQCRLARAPQGFIAADLWNAHIQAREQQLSDFIDSISLMAHFGYPIYTVNGPAENIKITTPSDFFAFKGYMDLNELGQLWEND